MSSDDLQRGLEALEDDDIRRRVAGGDLAAAGPLDLVDYEQALLRAAASDYPEVVGFDVRNWATLLVHKVKVDGPGIANKAKTADKAFQAMSAYIKS